MFASEVNRLEQQLLDGASWYLLALLLGPFSWLRVIQLCKFVTIGASILAFSGLSSERGAIFGSGVASLDCSSFLNLVLLVLLGNDVHFSFEYFLELVVIAWVVASFAHLSEHAFFLGVGDAHLHDPLFEVFVWIGVLSSTAVLAHQFPLLL